MRAPLAAMLACLASCSLVPFPVGNSDLTAPPPLRARDAEFQTLAERWFGIWSSEPGRIASAEALYADDADAIFFDGFEPVEGRFGRDGWSAASRRAAFARFDAFEITQNEGVWLRRNGDRAVSSIPFHFVLRMNGKTAESDGWVSLVWEHRGGLWKIVHEHCGITLLEDWLGGLETDLGPATIGRAHPVDPEFQRLVDAYLAELDASRTANAARANAPSSYFAPDLNVLVFEPTSRRPLLGWSSVAGYRDATDLRIYLTSRRTRQDVRVWKNGDWAWATFTFTARATRRNGDRFEVVGSQTDLFQRIDGRWLIVHEHASVPYGPEGTPGIRSELVLARSTPATMRSIPKLPLVVAGGSTIDGTEDRVEFGRRLEEYAQAWSAGASGLDWPRVQRLYAPEDELTFFEAPYGAVPASSSIEARKAAQYPGRTVKVIARPGLHVTRNGSIAWTTSTLMFEARAVDGSEERRELYQSAVWERRGDRWVIVDEHLSTVR